MTIEVPQVIVDVSSTDVALCLWDASVFRAHASFNYNLQRTYIFQRICAFLGRRIDLEYSAKNCPHPNTASQTQPNVHNVSRWFTLQYMWQV